MSREPLFMIWIRPVRGTVWYCCGFPIPAGKKERNINRDKWLGCRIVTNNTCTAKEFILDTIRWRNMTTDRYKQTKTHYNPKIRNERWVMYLVYLWHASTWPWEEGNHLLNSLRSLPSHRSHPGCWVAPQTEEALEKHISKTEQQQRSSFSVLPHFLYFRFSWGQTITEVT